MRSRLAFFDEVFSHLQSPFAGTDWLAVSRASPALVRKYLRTPCTPVPFHTGRADRACPLGLLVKVLHSTGVAREGPDQRRVHGWALRLSTFSRHAMTVNSFPHGPGDGRAKSTQNFTDRPYLMDSLFVYTQGVVCFDMWSLAAAEAQSTQCSHRTSEDWAAVALYHYWHWTRSARPDLRAGAGQLSLTVEGFAISYRPGPSRVLPLLSLCHGQMFTRSFRMDTLEKYGGPASFLFKVTGRDGSHLQQQNYRAL